MNKKILPIILIAGAALAFMAFRRKPRVTVTADSPIKQSETEFEAEFEAAQPAGKPSAVEVGTKILSTLFAKKTTQQKAAKKAQKAAVKRAKKSGITKKQAKAASQVLSRGIPKIGFSDDNVLV
jgi:hypothetical protein